MPDTKHFFFFLIQSYEVSRKDKLIETESKGVVAKGQRRVEWRVTAMVTGFLLGDGENVLKTDSMMSAQLCDYAKIAESCTFN